MDLLPDNLLICLLVMLATPLAIFAVGLLIELPYYLTFLLSDRKERHGHPS